MQNRAAQPVANPKDVWIANPLQHGDCWTKPERGGCTEFVPDEIHGGAPNFESQAATLQLLKTVANDTGRWERRWQQRGRWHGNCRRKPSSLIRRSSTGNARF